MSKILVINLFNRSVKIASSLLACCICLPRLERILGIRIAGGSSSVTSFVDKLTFCLFLGVHLRKADVIDSELKMFPMLHDCQRMAHQAECEIE